MPYFVHVLEDGCVSHQEELPEIPSEGVWYEIDSFISLPRTHDSQRWRWNGGQPVIEDTRTLSVIKALKNAEINEAKYKADQTSFTFTGKAIQADPHSMLQIQSANGIILLTGTIPNAAKKWKTLDNSYVDLPDIQTWTGFYAAMVMQGSSNFARAEALKAQLAAATTPEAVALINWE